MSEDTSKDNSTHELLPLTFCGFTKEMSDKALAELHENKGTLEESVRTLKDMINDSGTPSSQEDDFLALFLRCKKHDLQRSFLQLQGYTSSLQSRRRYHEDIHIHRIKEVLDTTICGILPQRDREGRAVIFFRASQFSSQSCDAEDVMKAIVCLIHFALSFTASQVNGICFIGDFAIHNLETLKIIVHYGRTFAPGVNSFPARIRRIDCINANWFVRTCAKIVMPLVPSKILRRVKFYADNSQLVNIYPASILPDELGGTGGPIKLLNDQWLQEFEEYLPKLIGYFNDFK